MPTGIKINQEEFIRRSNEIHKEKYLYSKTIYKTNNEKVTITCKLHGDFLQTPNAHLQGNGCNECGNDSKTSNTDIFIRRANEIHKEKYLYDNVIYVKSNEKVTIICKLHGDFLQTPRSHLLGSGCGKCSNTISKSEIMWLDHLNIPDEYRQKTIIITNKKFIVDSYNPITKTIYEFYGDYWHGNPKIYNPLDLTYFNKTFGELYEKNY